MIYGRKPVQRPKVPAEAEKPPEKPAEKPAEAADNKTDAQRKVVDERKGADDLTDYADAAFDEDDDKDDDWDVDFGEDDLNPKKKVQSKEVGRPADKVDGNKLKQEDSAEA